MSDLSEFLLARITEDETIARSVTPGPWTVDEAGCCVASESQGVIVETHGFDTLATHVARWDPARVLAECEAKRRIVEKLQDERHEVVEDCWYTCSAATEDHDGGECCNDFTTPGPCDCGRDNRAKAYLALLALPYADHPDYRPEWRP